MLSEKYLAWNTSGNLNFWRFISIFIKKKDNTLENFGEQ
jgi:hypothetical protein